MNTIIPILLLSLFQILSCRPANNNNEGTTISDIQSNSSYSLINNKGSSINNRILIPDGFQRIETSQNSFAYYLRTLPLKPHNSNVLLYNGKKKFRNVHAAVVSIDVGTKNLQQCADAIMRLRGEYLYAENLYEKIHFNLTNGFRVDYSKWMNGYRVKVTENHTKWIKSTTESSSYTNFRKYMDFIFTYAGTLSLSKELSSVHISDLKIGDIFIQGGSPGHAIIVVDVAIHKNSGKKIFLLAQSYMPAQEIHILKNPNNNNVSPWYEEDFGEELYTPEWTFSKNDLKRFILVTSSQSSVYFAN